MIHKFRINKLFIFALLFFLIMTAFLLTGSRDEPKKSVSDQVSEVTSQINSGEISAEDGSKKLCQITARREEDRQMSVDSIIDFSGDPNLVVEYKCNNFSPSRPDVEPTKETYLANGVFYTTSIEDATVLEVDPRGSEWTLKQDGKRNLNPPELLPTYSQIEMEMIAHNFVTSHLPGADLSSFKYTTGRKDSNNFFRWENTSKVAKGYQNAYIQIGISNNGQLLNYFDSISQRN